MPRDLIPPWGRTLLHGEAEKPTTAVGVASPKAVPWRGWRADLRAAGGGNGRAGGARRAVSAAGGATFGRSGGARRAEAGAGGQKSRTRGHNRGPRGVRGFRGPGKNRGKPGLHPGARRAKNGRRRGKTGRSGALQGRVRRALGAKKPLFAAKRAGNGAVLGRKLAEKAGGACRVIWPCARNLRAVSAEKLGASKKPFRAHIGRNCLSPLFFVDGAPSLGRIIWWFRRVAIWAEKSDECVTPRGTPHGKRKRRQPHENTDFRHRD